MYTPALMKRRYGLTATTSSRSVSRSVSPMSYRSCHSSTADHRSEFNSKLLKLLRENKVFDPFFVVFSFLKICLSGKFRWCSLLVCVWFFPVGRDDGRPGGRALHRDHGLRAAAVRIGRTAAARKGAAGDASGQEPAGRDQRAAGNAVAVRAVHRPVADVVLVVRGRHGERRRQRRGGPQRQGRPVLPAQVRARVPGVGVRQEAIAAAAQRRHGAAVGHEETARKKSESVEVVVVVPSSLFFRFGVPPPFWRFVVNRPAERIPFFFGHKV